jgi:hypothetical protein
MKVFISWSGNKSRKTAEIICNWLQQVIQVVEPWISIDIQKGKRWSPEISRSLEESKVGIVCLNRNNLKAPWLLFEAGAIAKTKDALTCTFLLDIKPSDVDYPLGDFQHTVYEKEDIKKLLISINDKLKELGEKHLADTVLQAVFETYWPELDKALQGVLKDHSSSREPVRTDRELLEEILERIRILQNEEFRNISFEHLAPLFSASTSDDERVYFKTTPGVTWTRSSTSIPIKRSGTTRTTSSTTSTTAATTSTTVPPKEE